ncbi:MAG: Ig-like domain-containing protein [Oscillospiraceae bacterium]|nr:Ig-like domain-containing protein [Oscillospiraceae bacterium]
MPSKALTITAQWTYIPPYIPPTYPIITQDPPITDENGNVITTMTQRNADGSTVETTVLTKVNGDTITTVVEKDSQGNVTKTTETTVETMEGGETVETEIVTDASCHTVTTITSTTIFGNQTIQRIEATQNSYGNTVTTTETTYKDIDGNISQRYTEHEIKNIGNGTDAVLTLDQDVDGNITGAHATIDKTGATKSNGVQATFTKKVFSQLLELHDGAMTIDMHVTNEKGELRYVVQIDVNNLTPKNDLKIYRTDGDGNFILVNSRTYTTDSKGQLRLVIRSTGNFTMKNGTEAAEINKAILATVKAKQSTATVKKGKTMTFAFHDDLDIRNVKSITYTTSKPTVATVDKNGKIKAKQAGTVTIKATVTLKNGTVKTVKMTVTVK